MAIAQTSLPYRYSKYYGSVPESGLRELVGTLLLLAFIFFLLYWGVPYIDQVRSTRNTQGMIQQIDIPNP
jgi:hypothetical protein